MRTPFPYYEFFAGGGMARQGLGSAWRCLLANEWCPRKANAYRINFDGAEELLVEDVAQLTTADLPGHAAMAWASFPCQDLSLAGKRAGIAGERSGTFHSFWSLMLQLKREFRMPPIVALENVTGALSSNQGKDFQYLLSTLANAGYRVGPLVMDAVHFVPQSRPRLFVVAVCEDIPVEGLTTTMSCLSPWQNRALHDAWTRLPEAMRDAWVWWRLPIPKPREISLEDIFEPFPSSVRWHSRAQTETLLGMMNDSNSEKVLRARQNRERRVGTIYKRTRVEGGKKVQRAEVRFDGVGGCLRTPAGGSSRQIVISVENDEVRTRLLSSREAARLMGLPDSYRLPDSYNEAYHLAGDGVVVPVVEFLQIHLLSPLASRVPANVAGQNCEQLAAAL